MLQPENIAPEGEDAAERARRIDALFREHNESLVRFLRARLHSRHEAMEVAQEAYVRLLNLEEPGAIGFLRAFLFRTAANLAVDRMRRGAREQRTQEVESGDSLVELRTPERQICGTEDVERVRQLVAELPPKCRCAFLLHRIDELGFGEIAERMNLSERMVRVYVHRALEHLQTGLRASHRIDGTDAHE